MFNNHFVKKLCSGVVFLSLLIGLVSVSFATTTPQSAAERLRDFGVVKGTESGFNLSGGLTREQALALFIRTLNEEAAAKKLAGVRSSFLDVKIIDWFSYYAVYAQGKGYTKGIGGGRFGTGAPVTNQEFMAFMLRGLGYTVSFDQVMAQAKALKLFNGVTESPYHYINRGEAFLILNQVMDTAKKGSSVPLSQSFEGALGGSTGSGATNGTLARKILAAEAIDSTAIKIDFDGALVPQPSDFLLQAAGGALMPINQLQTFVGEDTVVLTTSKMVLGQSYTLKYKLQSFSVVPYVLASGDYPRVSAVKAITPTQLRVTLSTNMVQRSSIAIENFSLDGGVSINDVSVDLVQMGLAENRNKLVLAVSVTPLTEAKNYTLTVKGLTSYKGFSGNSTLIFESASLDKSAPKMVSVTVLASDQLKLVFEDQTFLDPASVTQDNFNITPQVNVRSVTLTPSSVPGQYIVYVLTDHQTADVAYEISATRMSDGVNIMPGSQRLSFTGKERLLNLKPLYATTKALDVIEVVFSSDVHVESLIPENFALDGGFTVYSVSYAENLMMPGGIDKKKVWLKTQPIVKDKMVKVLLLKALKDVDGQGMIADQYYYVAGAALDDIFARGIVGFGIDENSCKLLFSENLDPVSAQDNRNYYVKDLGYAAKATLDQDLRTVYLTVPTVAKGQMVTLILNGIKDSAGNVITPDTKVYYVVP